MTRLGFAVVLALGVSAAAHAQDLTPPPPPPTAPPVTPFDAPPDTAPSRPPIVSPPPPPPPFADPQPGDAPYLQQPSVRFPQGPPPPRKEPAPLPPANGAVLFAPMSLFALYLTAELEVSLPAGLAVFGSLGGGLFGQLGFDAGLRWYPVGAHLEGAFVDLRGTGFIMPAHGHAMMGPGMGVGYAWRLRGLTASLGLGVQMWWTVWREPTATDVLGGTLGQSFVIPFPGFFEPPPRSNAMQPTVRLSLGPWF